MCCLLFWLSFYGIARHLRSRNMLGFAYPTRRSTSSLVEAWVWVYSRIARNSRYSLTSQDVLFAFLVIFLRNCAAFALAQYARVRIPHPKIDKLACRGLGVGIFAYRAKFPIFSNIARCAVCFFVIFLRNCAAFALAQYARVRIPHQQCRVDFRQKIWYNKHTSK